MAAWAYPTRSLRLAGITAILAAAAGTVADLVLQYSPNPAHLFSESLLALDVSPARLLVGHYLGIAAILIEITGFWQVSRALKPAGERVAPPHFLVNALGAAVGAIFHATFIFVALTVHAQQETTGAAYQSFADLLAAFNAPRIGLVTVAALAILVGSIWYGTAVGFKHTAYSHWMAGCTPLTIIILLGIVARVFPPVALVITPVALNLSHLAFFAFSTVILWNADQ